MYLNFNDLRKSYILKPKMRLLIINTKRNEGWDFYPAKRMLKILNQQN